MIETTDLIHANASRLLGSMLADAREDPWAEGARIGPYRLCERLGEGGFGTVWLVEQTEPVRRQVALKVIKRGMDTMQVLARFEQERQVLANMEHPSIASLLDAGVSVDGLPYFAMELVKGEPITLWCRHQNLQVPDRLRLFEQVCHAVQHAHHKGIIHRDLKPSNILITSMDGKPLPKVIDFGIAKALHSSGAEAGTLLTQAGQLLGTPVYMSPEQIEGSECIDTRSDVYSLGMLLYELLAGVPAFDAATNTPEMHRLIREVTPLRPSIARRKQQETRGRQGIPGRGALASQGMASDLDWITMRALEKDRERRYQSPAELAADLLRYLQHQPVLACPPSFRYVAGRWIQRNRAAFVAACVCVAALVAATGISLWQARIARQAQQFAEGETRRAVNEARIAAEESAHRQQAMTFLNGLLARVANEVSRGRNPEALTPALKDCEQQIRSLKISPGLRINLLVRVTSIYEGIGAHKLEIPLLRAIADEFNAWRGPHDPDTRNTELAWIKKVIDHGDRATSPGLLENLRRQVERHGDRGRPFWFDVQRQLVRAWTKLKAAPEAVAAAQDYAAEASRQNYSRRELVTVELGCADAYDLAGQYDQARHLLERCRETVLASPGERHRLVDIENRMIHLCWSQKDFSRAAALLRDQLIRLQQDPDAQPEKIIAKYGELVNHEVEGHLNAPALADAQAAVDFARRQIPLEETGVPEPRGDVTFRTGLVLSLRALSHAERASNDYAAATQHAEEALMVARELGNSVHILKSLEALTDCHRGAGRFDTAFETLKLHAEQLQLTHGACRERLDDFEDMATIRLEQKRYKEAMELATKMWRELQAIPGSEDDAKYRAGVEERIMLYYRRFRGAFPYESTPADISAWTLARDQQKQTDAKLKSAP